MANINSANGRDRRYKGLLLDFGNVIARSFFETRPAFERLLKLPPGALDWTGPFDPASDPLWQQVVAGEFSERAYWERRAQDVGKLVGERWTIREFCLKHNELPFDITLNPDMVALIYDAKRAGLKFGILSNELALFHGDDWLRTMPFADQIDGVVDASHTHILKPDKRAYELGVQMLGLAAQDVVFIDDQRRNVAGGEAAGLRSLHFEITNYGPCVTDARELMGL